MLNEQEYDYVLRIAVENAEMIVSNDDKIKRDEDRFHNLLFSHVLTEIDNGAYSHLDARDVSEVCSEVEGDVIHGDILGI